MKTQLFEYHLPKELIAQTAVEPRDASKLLIIDRSKSAISDGIFKNIINYLSTGDVLVLNDTKVIHNRLPARKKSGAKVEVFLLKNLGSGLWETLVKPGSKLHKHTEVVIGDSISARILSRTADGGRLVQFPTSRAAEDAIKRFGQVPLPPYIKKPLSNPARYQTVYAEKDGSVAAPTAALHWTKELLARIEARGVVIVYITLHMGLGSFRPIKAKELASHRMPEEYYEIPSLAASRINQAIRKGNKIIACGTDVVRALESSAKNRKVVQGKGATKLFITPGYKFKIVDTLITNLHLPRSSHLVLVSAFAGREFVLEAYQYAIKKKFRFYTFGDATIVI